MTIQELINRSITKTGNCSKLARWLTRQADVGASERTVYNWRLHPRRMPFAAIYALAGLVGVDMADLRP